MDLITFVGEGRFGGCLMSDLFRVAVAVEGPTDAIVLEAILNALLPDTDFVLQTLQPEESRAFDTSPSGGTGAGWAGVYRWCRQSVSEGDGSVSGSSAMLNHDVLIVQVDADVASKTYDSGGIRNAPRNDLPCEQPCPPPSRTTDALRAVVLSWLGESNTPPQVVLSTPSKNIEAWVLAAVWPDNNLVQRGDWECRRNPEDQLRALPKARQFEKSQDDYKDKQEEIESGWRDVAARLAEAGRFEREFLAAISARI